MIGQRLYQFFILPLRKLTILHRLILIVCCSIILPNIFLMLSFNQEAKQQFTQNIISHYQNTIANVESTIETRISLIEDTLMKNALDSRVLDSLSNPSTEYNTQTLLDQCYNEFSTTIKPYILNMMIINEKQQFTSSQTNAKNQPIICNFDLLKKTDYYQKACLNSFSPSWQNTTLDKDMYYYSSYPRIYLSNYLTVIIGLEYNNQNTAGCLILNISTKIFDSLYTSNKVNYESFYLYNESGFLSPLHYDAAADKEIYQYFNDAELKGIGGNSTETINNEKYLLFYMDTNLSGWYVAAIIKSEKAFQHITSIHRQTIFTTGLVLTLAVLAAAVIGLSISIPLNRLKHVVSGVGQNDLEIDYNDIANDEIGQLGQGFKKMLCRIQKLIKSMMQIEFAQKNEQIRIKKSELEALQMQIKPHFLYNTLDIIRWSSLKLEKTVASSEHEVSNMVFHLSRMLLYSVKDKDKLVSIYDEVQHINTYLALLKYTKKWNVKLVVPHTSEHFLTCQIVRLTLQPIIENAILHGLPHTDKLQKLYLNIRKKKACLIISVIDHGFGIEPDILNEIQTSICSDESNNHIGLKNVNERIKLFFGESYGLQLYSNKNCFTSVMITIPY